MAKLAAVLYAPTAMTTPSTPSAIEISGLVVRYGAHEALKGVDFRFHGGSLGLLGPNGAGKSSLMRTLLGLVEPATGTARVLGIDSRHDPIGVRMNTGYMPENDCHVPGLTGIEFVTYSGRLCGMRHSDAQQRAHEMMIFVGLGEERYRPIDDYSRGMKQKAKLAAALVHDPSLLLLDEPTNGLDPQSRNEVLELIRTLAQDRGVNVVLSSHLLKDVEVVCSEIVVLHAGRVRASGVIEDLKNKGGGFVVRLNGEPHEFARLAQERGFLIEREARGGFIVRDGTSIVTPRALFELARAAGSTLRAFDPLEESLEELFMRSLQVD